MTRPDQPHEGNHRFAACFAQVMPARVPERRHFLHPAWNPVVFDERVIAAYWCRQFSMLGEHVDRERVEQRHSVGLGGYLAAWRLALLIERVYEPQTTAKPVLAWFARTPDVLWSELGFWRRPTEAEVQQYIVPHANMRMFEQTACHEAICLGRQIVASPALQQDAIRQLRGPR